MKKDGALLKLPSRKSFLSLNQGEESPSRAVRISFPPTYFFLSLRILIGTSFILFITGSASVLGPRLTGLLTTVPLYVTILAIFAHRHQGPAAAAHVLRGLLYGLFAFAGFQFTLVLLLEKAGVGMSFIAAIVVALLIQGTSLWILQQKHT